MQTRQVRIRPLRQSLLQQSADLHPQIKRILAAREIESLEDIDYRLERLLPLDAIRNIDAAAELLLRQAQQQKRILIFGDYDADGATSTALCLRALAMMGVASVSYLMPDRFIDGYGLSLPVALRIIELAPDCVITVDNGIASLDGIAALRASAIEVIVTDHHLPGPVLPDASVILNQNAWPDETRGRNLAGVGVVFYLMLALRKRLRECGWFEAASLQPNLATCLDLVALGTVADLVPLDFNNRILVNEGLRRIRANQCSAGITALIEVAGKQPAWLSSSDLAFTLAPRINAAGRLEDISIGVACLIADEPHQAVVLARQLEQINAQRKHIQQQMEQQAGRHMDAITVSDIESRYGIVLYQADWHEGLVGIIAARIREKYNRPSIVFAMAEDGSLKGSGRSLGGIHLRDMLDRVDRAHPLLIDKFGGHAMAAGLSIAAENLASFTQAFNQVIETTVDPACFDGVIDCDGELAAECHSIEFARQLQSLSPWGQGFPAPSFIGDFEVLEQRILSGKHLKLQLKLEHGDLPVCDAIAFFQPTALLQQNRDRIKIHYQLDINRYRGIESLQLLIRDIL